MAKSRTKPFVKISFFTLLLITAALFGYVYLKTKGNTILPVSNIKITSNYEKVSPEKLKSVISSYVSDKNFLTLNIAELKKELETIPWLYSSNIRRIWPGTLVVEIQEEQPIARFNQDTLINRFGETFHPKPSSIPRKLPLIKTTKAQLPKTLKHYKKMTPMIRPLNLHIVYLEFTIDGDMKVTLNNEIHLLLGKKNIIQHWNRFVVAYPKLLSESKGRHIEQVDLRYSNGLAVKWVKN